MSNFELEGIYPIDDPRNLPIKTIDLGNGSIFMKGEIDISHVYGLSDISVEVEKPITYVKFSVWEDSGMAKALDQQLLIGGAILSVDPHGLTPVAP